MNPFIPSAKDIVDDTLNNPVVYGSANTGKTAETFLHTSKNVSPIMLYSLESKMADFCYQCTAGLFGAEYAPNNDMKGIADPTYVALVLCEGCSGYVWVDSEGKCVEHYTCELAQSAYSIAYGSY